jgi:hypothetical protein
MEGWDFLLAGGGLYNNLDYSFTAGHEDGTFALPDKQPGGGGKELRKQLRVLKDFIYGFDFVKMKPDKKTVHGKAPAGLSVRGLSEPGKQYAFYLRPRVPKKDEKFEVKSRKTGEVVLRLALPTGEYRAEWLEPATGKVLKDETFTADGKERALEAPAFAEDVALRVRRTHAK